MLTKKSCRGSLAIIAFPASESTTELNQHRDAEPSPIVGLGQYQYLLGQLSLPVRRSPLRQLDDVLAADCRAERTEPT